MTSSFTQNINRLKTAERRNLERSTSQRTQTAEREGQRGIDTVRDITQALKPFSQKLQEWEQKAIERHEFEGKLAAREANLENAERLYELSEELKRTKQEDTRYQEIKAEMLKLEGPSVYPQADRIAKLSPWQQVGYAQEKLRVFNESFDEKLAYSMANSERAIQIQGITFTPKELHDNNISDPILKEAALQIVSQEIKDAAELDRFSPEMLRLAGTSDAITKSQEAQLTKYRTRYNIESSANTRGKAQLEWKNSAKTGDDIYRYLLINGATIDKNGDPVGYAGAWAKFDAQLVSEGVASDNPEYAVDILNQPIPNDLATKLGVKKGTTFAQHWPNKLNTLRTEIKAGIKEKVDAENAFLKAAGTDLDNEFIQRARQGDLSSQEVNAYKSQFAELGLPPSTVVKDYETVSDRNQREDEDLLEALVASQNGYISNEQLDAFHPIAALKYREKADSLEKAAIEKHDADKKIKAHMDTVFTGMGIKANEKSPAYVEALSNAKADYAQKYHRYISMGYSSEAASYEALNAKAVIDPETKQAIPDSMGVLTEIKTNEAGSKYVITGQSLEKTLHPGRLRVAQIYNAKEEILNDPTIISKNIIGGDYGHRQITTIKNNIEKIWR